MFVQSVQRLVGNILFRSPLCGLIWDITHCWTPQKTLGKYMKKNYCRWYQRFFSSKTNQTKQFFLPVTEQLVFIWFPIIIKVKILWKCIKHLLKLVLKTPRKENVCWRDDYRCWSEQEEPGSNIFLEERLHKVSIPCFGFNDIMRDVDNAWD